MFEKYVDLNLYRLIYNFISKVIARIVDGSEFDEFKKLYGETLVTGKKLLIQFSTVRYDHFL